MKKKTKTKRAMETETETETRIYNANENLQWQFITCTMAIFNMYNGETVQLNISERRNNKPRETRRGRMHVCPRRETVLRIWESWKIEEGEFVHAKKRLK